MRWALIQCSGSDLQAGGGLLLIWDSVPSQGTSLAVVLISFVRRSLGFCALWSERALVPVPPTALPALPGVLKQPGLRLSGSQEGTNSKQVSNYSNEAEGFGSGSWYVVILCWTLWSHNWLLHVRSWLCRIFLLRNRWWYLEKLTWHRVHAFFLWFPVKHNWDASFPLNA